MLRLGTIWCIDSPGWGGAEKDLVRILRMLAIRPEAVICGKNMSPNLEQFFLAAGIPLVRRRGGNGWRVGVSGLASALRLVRGFPRRQFVVWAHHSDSSRWLQLALVILRRRPILVERAPNPTAESLSSSRLTKPIKRFVVSGAKAVILCGHRQKAEFEQVFGVADKKISVIPNTRDIAGIAGEIAKLRRDIPALRRELRMENLPTVLCAGRLDAVKRQDVLIRAIAIVNQQIDARLVLIGEGPRETELRQLGDAVAPGLVQFAGYQANPLSWLAAADAFALVSAGEGLSGALIEAMASRTPCVVSRIPANEELVEEGVTGRLVAVGDAAATAAAIEEFLGVRDTAQRIAEAAFEEVAASYDQQLEHALWEKLLI